MTTDHYATLIVEQPDGYIACKVSGTPDQYLRQPNQRMFTELPTARQRFHDWHGNFVAYEGETIATSTSTTELHVATEQEAREKCLELLLAQERVAQNDVHWIWRLGKGEWKQIVPSTDSEEQHL